MPNDRPGNKMRLRLALLGWLPALAGLAFLVAYLYVGTNRLLYPFEIEWMEGGSVDHVARIFHSQPLYVAPSIDFVPYLYTPFYYYLSALVSAITGLGLFPLRLVSFLATLCCFFLIGDFVRRETGSSAAALAAGGFYAATYPLSGYWLELARVDSLAIALLLGGGWIVRFRTSARALFIAGSLWGLSYLTKQSMLLVIGPLALWTLLAHRWRGVWAAGGCALFIGPATLYLILRNPGWYLYYTVQLPGMHRIWWGGWTVIWRAMIFKPFAVAALAGAVVSTRRNPRMGSFYLVLLFASLGISTLAMMHSGAAANVLMPGYAGLAITFGLAIACFTCGLSQPLGGSRKRALLRVAALCGVAWACHQFWLFRYDVKAQLMTTQDVAAGRIVIERLKTIDGEVYLPNHGYLGTLAGKATHAQAMAVADILRSTDSRRAALLREDIARAVNSRRFGAILSDAAAPTLSLFDRPFATYELAEDFLAGVRGFTTRTGNPCRPSQLYRPTPAAPPAR